MFSFFSVGVVLVTFFCAFCDHPDKRNNDSPYLFYTSGMARTGLLHNNTNGFTCLGFLLGQVRQAIPTGSPVWACCTGRFDDASSSWNVAPDDVNPRFTRRNVKPRTVTRRRYKEDNDVAPLTIDRFLILSAIHHHERLFS